MALLVAFAAVPSRTDSAFKQMSCWRTVLLLDFINSVLAQLHDLHCFGCRAPLLQRATFLPGPPPYARVPCDLQCGAWLSCSGHAQPDQHYTVFVVAVPARQVP
eukprot:642604-Pleurochrysis_carterae.AAC.1